MEILAETYSVFMDDQGVGGGGQADLFYISD